MLFLLDVAVIVAGAVVFEVREGTFQLEPEFAESQHGNTLDMVEEINMDSSMKTKRFNDSACVEEVVQ